MAKTLKERIEQDRIPELRALIDREERQLMRLKLLQKKQVDNKMVSAHIASTERHLASYVIRLANYLELTNPTDK